MLVPREEYEAIVTRIVGLLDEADLRTVRTFDLKSACAERPAGVCPHHGTAPCNCQMSVLLVYGQTGDPMTLTAHQCDGRTWLSLALGSQQRTEPALEARILQALAPGAFAVER